MSEPTDAAIHEAFLANRRLVREVSGDGALEELDGWQLYDSGAGLQGLNQAMVVGGAAPRLLGPVEEWYRARGVPFCLALRDPQDAALIAAAEANGYVRERRQPVMARMLPCPESAVAGLSWREVRSASDALRFLAARREPGKQRPPDASEGRFIERLAGSGRFKYFVGEVDGEPVTTVTTVAAGEVAIVANLFVKPAWRRRGIGGAVTARAAGAWAHARSVSLEASREGALLYVSMGFETRFHYVRLLPPAP